MLLDDLLKKSRDLEYYVKNMPPDIRQRAMIKTSRQIILSTRKTIPLKLLASSAAVPSALSMNLKMETFSPSNRMKRSPSSEKWSSWPVPPYGSAAVETTTESTVLFISRSDFETWASQDIHILGLVSKKIAEKLYRSAFELGAKRFYSPVFFCWTFS